MPITSTSSVSKEISSLHFNSDDTLVVTLVVNSTGAPTTSESYTLQPVVVAALLDAPPPVGYTLRQAVISKVYTALIDAGFVVGEITA